MNQMTLAVACRKHLSIEGETLQTFGEEMKKLTLKDRDDLKIEFAKIGVEIIEKK